MAEEIVTWIQLNDALRKMTREDQVLQMYHSYQKSSWPNPRWIRRIWGRYAQLRKRREKKELLRKMEHAEMRSAGEQAL